MAGVGAFGAVGALGVICAAELFKLLVAVRAVLVDNVPVETLKVVWVEELLLLVFVRLFAIASEIRKQLPTTNVKAVTLLQLDVDLRICMVVYSLLKISDVWKAARL